MLPESFPTCVPSPFHRQLPQCCCTHHVRASCFAFTIFLASLCKCFAWSFRQSLNVDSLLADPYLRYLVLSDLVQFSRSPSMGIGCESFEIASFTCHPSSPVFEVASFEYIARFEVGFIVLRFRFCFTNKDGRAVLLALSLQQGQQHGPDDRNPCAGLGSRQIEATRTVLEHTCPHESSASQSNHIGALNYGGLLFLRMPM